MAKHQKPKIIDNNTEAINRENKSETRELTMEYSGPIPHPSILNGYQNIDKSFPDRIMSEFENNSMHIRKQEDAALAAQIADNCRGQWMAFSIAIVLLLLVAFSLFLGNTTFAGLSGLAFFTLMIKSFLGTDKDKKEK